jgi:hypothetical protein
MRKTARLLLDKNITPDHGGGANRLVIQRDLEAARRLVRMGVPLFLSDLKPNGDPIPPAGWLAAHRAG